MLVIGLSLHCFSQSGTKSPEEESAQALETGKAKADNNNWEGAVNDFSNAIAYYGRNQEAFYRRALARQNLKDYRGAIMDYSKAIYLNNNDAASFLGRGICYWFIGMKEKCCADLSKAESVGNSDATQAIQNYCN